ncbi:MAG TPA: DinB family protein, partial [Bdellovibrionota bacterium]|nr:DinB family protein [Bdellovibrionota bacterium]
YQRAYLRLWLKPVVSRRMPRSEVRANFDRLAGKLVEKISEVPAELRNTKILVEPIRGLEDSSRYWSLNGVLEHVLIVSQGLETIILMLAAGKRPPIEVDIAKVKPKHRAGDLLEEFQAYAPKLYDRLDAALAQPGMDLDSRLTHRHPWFGDLTARQWYWLISSHVGVHYAQAKAIIAGLPWP